MNNLSERVKHARLSAGLTQGELAELISQLTGRDVLKGTISAWENGRVENPSAAFMIALQEITGFRAAWLTNGTAPQKIDALKAPKRNAEPAALNRKILQATIEDVLKVEPRPEHAAKRITRLYVARTNIDPKSRR